ncbi:hypothetical protein QTP70_028017 [Hemibagrus guttatus]|uniref:Legumain prodomain domain-containing protein n=1 Tax=Hemibagrus guttatus TaxID=175788 RepID=A0AAE0UYY3_9TELE|nr:hypothetical protein QTP70_028017 [Hemibagrus guttatus]KAK3555630.1 hypothetical protein QTP86_025614 [Hemibagrus guttatus]
MMEVKDVVANKDVAMMILQKNIQSAKTPEEREQYEKQVFELHQGKEMVIKSMQQIVEKCTDSKEAMHDILHGKSQEYASLEYKEVVEHYREKCFNWHETKYQSSMDHLYIFANLLHKKVPVERIKNAIDEVGAAMRAKMEKESVMEQ